MFDHEAISDATTSAPARLEITFTDQDFIISELVSIAYTNLTGNSITVESFKKDQNKITVLIQTPQIKKKTTYYIEFTDMKLAPSKQTMQPVII